MTMLHDIKILPVYFEAWMKGKKRCELRNADRNYEVGDTVRMWEWDPKKKKYTGKMIVSEILHIDDVQEIMNLHGASMKSVPVKNAKGFKEITFCILSLATRKIGKATPPEK